MLVNSVLPSAVMSAGGTTAVCATISRPLPEATGERSLVNTVTTGLFAGSACECSTTSWLPVTSTDFDTVQSGLRNATVWVPGDRASGPTTFLGATPLSTDLPSTRTSTSVPGTPWTTYVEPASLAAAAPPMRDVPRSAARTARRTDAVR